ncbi:hypothetical protein IG631_15457 [Alternaria alternata]|nr:hypothetical protein IG631_15457 [Alternaria alternata]
MATAMVRKLRPRTINRRPSRLAGLRLAWEFHDLGTLPEDPLQTANDKPPGTVDAAFTTHPQSLPQRTDRSTAPRRARRLPAMHRRCSAVYRVAAAEASVDRPAAQQKERRKA